MADAAPPPVATVWEGVCHPRRLPAGALLARVVTAGGQPRAVEVLRVDDVLDAPCTDCGEYVLLCTPAARR